MAEKDFKVKIRFHYDFVVDVKGENYGDAMYNALEKAAMVGRDSQSLVGHDIVVVPYKDNGELDYAHLKEFN